MLKYLLLLIVGVLSLNLLQAQTHRLTEGKLMEMAQTGSPRLAEITAHLLSAQVSRGETQAEFAPELFGRGAYAETNERALIAFQPVFSPIAQAQLGVRQNFKHGLTTQAAIVTDQRSSGTSPFAGKFRDATTTTLNFTMQLDVWKNLFGRISKARLENAELEAKSANLQKEIQTKAFKITLRRLYWSLVANNESMKISEELLKTAQTQAGEAGLRFKNAVADSDEVARYEAQVTSRQSSILYLKYQRETLLTQLRNLLPAQLGTGEVLLGDYDLGETIGKVLACTGRIVQEKAVPYEYTKYDELSGLLKKMRTNSSTINSRFADADVKLFGTVKATGVASEPAGTNTFKGSYGGTFDDMTETNRTGYEVGVMFSVPLGDVKESTQKVKELYDEKRFEASIVANDAQVINTHKELVTAINYLNEVIANQRLTVAQLGKRLAGMRKKYQQARVSVNDLIQDQDALFNSELTIIDTQLQILNMLFDYLVVYTETPCSFNRI